MYFKLNFQKPLAPVTVVNPLTTTPKSVVCFAAGANGYNFLKNAKQTTQQQQRV